MRCYVVSGVFAYTKPHRWSLVLEDTISPRMFELEGHLNLMTRVVSGTCTNVNHQAASCSRVEAGGFHLRSIGDATLLTGPPLPSALGWPEKCKL